MLIVDDDRDVGEIAYAVLTDAGFDVSVLGHVETEAIRLAIGTLEPDCVLLDGESPGGFGQSWIDAAWMSSRSRRVPVIMFTVDTQAVREEREGATDRSLLAQFDAVLPKPFDLDELIEAVAHAVGESVPFETAEPAEPSRTPQLKAMLQAAGAHDIRLSDRREWATFRTATGTLVQIYWSQRDGAYYVMLHVVTEGRMDMIGRVFDLNVAIALAMHVPAENG